MQADKAAWIALELFILGLLKEFAEMTTGYF